LADLRLTSKDEEEVNRRRKQAAEAELGLRDSALNLNPSGTLEERTVDTSGPDIPPALGFGETASGAVAPTFGNLFGDFRTGELPVGVGSDEGQVAPEDLLAAGGPRNILEGERTSMGIGTALDLTNALLGRPTGTQSAQQAEDPKFGLDALSPYQRVLLGIADIVAVSQGDIMPSAQLKAQGKRGLTLEDQNNRQALTTGFKLMKDTTDLLADSGMSREDRIAAAATQVPIWESLLEGSGTIGLAIASNPTEADAMHAFFNNPDAFTGTMAEQWANYVFAVGLVDPARAGTLIEKAIDGGIISKTIDNVGPSIVQSLLPAQIDAARKMGGQMAEFANDLALGKEMTAEKYINWHAGLPKNLQMKGAYLESLSRDPSRYLTVFPGLSTPELIQKEKEADLAGERSAPIGMVNIHDLTDIVGGPRNGKFIRNLGSEYVPMGPYATALFGEKGAQEAGTPFGPLSPAMITDIQKELKDLRKTADELISIEEGYSRDLQTFGSRIRNVWLGAKASVTGGELSSEDEAFRRRFIGNRTRTLNSLSFTLNRLSGAAVSPQEFERIKQTRPADTDDPDEFRFKLETAIGLTMFSIARMHAWEMTGNTAKEAFTMRREDVRGIMRDKMQQLHNAYLNAYPDATEEKILESVARDIAKAFGVRVKDLSLIFEGGDDFTFEGGPQPGWPAGSRPQL